MTDGPDITRLLDAAARGDPGAEDDLFSVVYADLRAQAARQLSGRRAGETLQATALVNEAYVRLFAGEKPVWENRRHFFFAAARAMRDVTVDYARRRAALKRGGDRRRVDLDDDRPPDATSSFDTILGIDAALEDLRAHDARCGDAVLLRFFGGLTHEQVAAVLGISTARARREWDYARAWLRERLEE